MSSKIGDKVRAVETAEKEEEKKETKELEENVYVIDDAELYYRLRKKLSEFPRRDTSNKQ